MKNMGFRLNMVRKLDYRLECVTSVLYQDYGWTIDETQSFSVTFVIEGIECGGFLFCMVWAHGINDFINLLVRTTHTMYPKNIKTISMPDQVIAESTQHIFIRLRK